ncbi:hypothetical protein, partial [Leucobacter chinensis]|uniref:hypothetical protein n=1 Tax=Leucobacter chinensis TaxID=2851010 RepID=UPI001C22C1E2
SAAKAAAETSSSADASVDFKAKADADADPKAKESLAITGGQAGTGVLALGVLLFLCGVIVIARKRAHRDEPMSS